jgi:hypothetical protein
MQGLWLEDKNYDAAFFHLPALACLLLLVPYYVWGSSVILPIYIAYLLFFGLPHSFLTWATFLPRNAAKSVDTAPVKSAALKALALCLLVPVAGATELGDWLLTAISVLALWHVYEQHLRICRLYDAVQVLRSGDTTLYDDRKPMDLFFGLAVMGIAVWACTRGELTFYLSAEEKHRLIHPPVPWELFRLYLAVTLMAGTWAFKRVVIDRVRDRMFVPWPQISVMTLALGTLLIPFALLPLEAMPLAVAVAMVFHSVQYFGFVWMFERHRTQDLPRYEALLGTPQRLVREGAWRHYFGLGFAFSSLVVALYLSLPRQAGAFVVSLIAVSHYLVDGQLWRREHNSAVPRVIDRLSGIAREPASRLRRVI